MNHLKTIKTLLVIVALLLVSTTEAATGHEHKKENIKMFTGMGSEPYKTVKNFHKALKTKNKSLALSSLHEQVTIFEGGKVERSASEYASHHMQADMNYVSSVNVELLEHHVEIIGEVAISIARTKTTGFYKNKTVNRQGMETIVLRKYDGIWKISHIHW